MCVSKYTSTYTICLLGGKVNYGSQTHYTWVGYGGLQAAKILHKYIKKRRCQDFLIDQNDYHTLLTELHEVAGYGIEPHGVKVSIEHVLEYTKVDFIKDRIIGADLKEKKLYSETAQYYFDYLIIGVGSEPAYFNIEGMENHSFPLWSLEDAKRIQSISPICSSSL